MVGVVFVGSDLMKFNWSICILQLAGLDLQGGQSQKSNTSVGRYIPPHLRNKQLSGSGEDNHYSDRDSSSANYSRHDSRGGGGSGYRGEYFFNQNIVGS